jgi:hypothetical protein
MWWIATTGFFTKEPLTIGHTIQAEKELIVYDQKIWYFNYKSTKNDTQGNPIPGWQDIDKTRDLYNCIKSQKPQSPYLKNSSIEFTETLGLIKEENQNISAKEKKKELERIHQNIDSHLRMRCNYIIQLKT